MQITRGLLLALSLVGGLASQGVAQGIAGRVNSGELQRSDRTLSSGEYYDEIVFEGRAGQRVTLDLTTSEFDPYLLVVAPSGDKESNDDFDGALDRSRLELTLSETGRYQILVTSYEEGETGDWQLRIDTESGGGGQGNTSAGVRVEAGELARGDETLRSGEFADEYTFEAGRGESIVVEVSGDFDTYLIVSDPDGDQEDNDDYEGNSNRSLLTLNASEAGTYRVLVTSYREGETGDYELTIRRGSTQTTAGPRVEPGRLASGDATSRAGAYVDTYEFQGFPGQRVSIDLTSDDFDTVVRLVPPRGEQQENDDADSDVGHSLLDLELSEAGTYEVLVTSYEAGETGEYELRIDVAGGGRSGADARDVVLLDFGETADGALADGDSEEDGQYTDLFTFDGEAGEEVVIELETDDFDPLLRLRLPNGEELQNDDWDDRLDLSRIELRLPESGRFRVAATSYAEEETGDYRLRLSRGGRTPEPEPASSGGRTFGVFVGISDYPPAGPLGSDLRFTAQDARTLQQAMMSSRVMREADSVLLVDGEATSTRVRQAIEDMARRAGPADTFVLFYSGHGNSVPRSVFQSTDADGFDETLTLHDEEVTDDEFEEWLSALQTDRTIILLDSCFSGGFSKGVLDARGRMGLFSSEERVLSAVADKFRAGGFLSHFVAEAIGGWHADMDGNDEITAFELSHYVHERYRVDVKSDGTKSSSASRGDFIDLDEIGYQHLVADYANVGPYTVLFRR